MLVTSDAALLTCDVNDPMPDDISINYAKISI